MRLYITVQLARIYAPDSPRFFRYRRCKGRPQQPAPTRHLRRAGRGYAAGQRLVQPLDIWDFLRRRAGRDAVGVLPHDAGRRLRAGYVDWSGCKLNPF